MTRSRLTPHPLLLTLLALLLTLNASPSRAGCDHSYTNITESDANGPINTTSSNYYRGEIHTFDRGVGICRVTAYMSSVNYASSPSYIYTLKLWSVSGDNQATLLGTAEDVYQGGNWTTPSAKTFHFYDPVKVPAGRVAISISDGVSAHPTAYHVWHRAPAQTGSQACSWTSAGLGNCTSEYSQMMEIDYVEAPYLTAKWTYWGWPRMQIPEWGAYGAEWCDMTDDNITVACELPGDLPEGPHKLKARLCHSDDNASRCSGWGHLRYRTTKSGQTTTNVINHSSGDTTATITGTYK